MCVCVMLACEFCYICLALVEFVYVDLNYPLIQPHCYTILITIMKIILLVIARNLLELLFADAWHAHLEHNHGNNLSCSNLNFLCT